jgi:hypothetical protein
VRHRWDEGAATHDLSPEHFPRTKAQGAAWNAALTQHLPLPPAPILGAGAGALSAPRFCACYTARDPRTEAPLPDRRFGGRGEIMKVENARYMLAALHMSGVHGAWCGGRRRRMASLGQS